MTIRICYAPDDAVATAPSPAPSAPAPSNDVGNSGIDAATEAAKIFDFDAFEPPAQPSTTDPAPAPVPPAGTPAPSPAAQPPQPAAAPAAPAPVAAPAATAPGAAPPAAGQMSPEEASLLRQQVRDYEARLAQQPQPGGQPQPGQPGEPEVDVPPYQFQIPQELGQLLTSENPQERLAGTNYLLTGAARTVHKTVHQAIRTELGKVLPVIVNTLIQQHAQQQAVFNDFYGTFKELNRPELYTLVKQVGQQVMEEYGTQTWSADLRNAVGQRVKQIISGAIPAPASMQPTLTPAAPATAAPAQPPHMTGTTSRPAPLNASSEQAEMASLLDFRS